MDQEVTQHLTSTTAQILSADGALAHSGARAVDTFSTCGSSVVIMAVVTLFSVIVSAYLIKQLLTLVKDGIKSNYELKGAIDDAIDGNDYEA